MHNCQVFVVRVWWQRGEFRAALRAPDNGEPQLFTEPARLVAYLAAADGDKPEDGGGDEHDANR